MFRAGQCLDGLEVINNPSFAENINDICAVCLQQHENLRTLSMQDMLSAHDEIEVYKILESISLFRYSAKTLQWLCSSCSFKLLNIYEFQQMCNKSYFYFNTYIKQKDTHDIYKLEIEDKGDVQTITENEQFMEEVGDNSFPLNWVENEQKPDRIGVISESHTLDDKASISTKILNTPTMILPLTNTEKEHFIFTIEDAEDDTCKFEIEDTEIHGLDSDSEGSIKSTQERIDHQAGSTAELTEHGAHPKGHLGLDEKKSCIAAKTSLITKFVCKYCNKVLCSKQALIAHKNLHTGEKPYKCDQCMKAFASSQSLHNHKITHNPERRVCCDRCGKKFNSKRYLKRHMEIHTNQRSHVCSICSKGFSQKSKMVKHRQRHNNKDDKMDVQKPFPCDQCPKSFTSRQGLSYHKLDHGTDRPFACNSCPRTFKCKASLNVHIANHVNARPYVCSICGKDFTFESYMLAHMRRVHNNGDNNELKITVKKS